MQRARPDAVTVSKEATNDWRDSSGSGWKRCRQWKPLNWKLEMRAWIYMLTQLGRRVCLEILPTFRYDYTEKWETRGRKYYKSVSIIMMFRVVLACWRGACIISENFPFGLWLPIKLHDHVERLRYIIAGINLHFCLPLPFFFFFRLGKIPIEKIRVQTAVEIMILLMFVK